MGIVHENRLHHYLCTCHLPRLPRCRGLQKLDAILNDLAAMRVSLAIIRYDYLSVEYVRRLGKR
jgi:hypothetical protein